MIGRAAGTVLALIAVATSIAGCGVLGSAFSAPGVPQACDRVFNAVRCVAIRDSAAFRLHTTREDIIAVDIQPDPTPEIIDGKTILRTTSGGKPVELVVTLSDGTTQRVTILCAGIPDDPGCFDDPHLLASSVTMGGYHDFPEDATPVPSAAPEAIADATELRIDRLDIPIDHVGLNEIHLGEVLLPNGLLTAADFALVDDWPHDITILERSVNLEIRSLVDGKTIYNIYEHGWREGTERVEAVLVFNVFRFDPGAKLGIRNVVVR
jgi:hypothetical protein